MNLWLGSPGVVAHTHNDQSPNWAAQIYGHKRWILSPPSEAHKLYPYPNLHSFRSQSQVDFKTRQSIDGRARASGRLPDLDDNHDLYPDFRNVTAYEAILSPGEILFIPAFWFHRVVTEDTSIAVNTWSHIPGGGNPHSLMDRVPLPFEEDWSLERKVVALKLFATKLGERLAASTEIVGLEPAFSLLHKQYDSLFFGAFGRAGARRFGKDLKPLCDADHLNEFVANLNVKIEEGTYLTKLMEQLVKLKDADARRMLFLSYLESVMYILLEDPELIYPFIRDCLPREHNV